MWSFGHSFDAAGARNLLLQDAYVSASSTTRRASTGGSYKLAVAGHDVGTLSNDGFNAVVGRSARCRAITIACARSAPTTTPGARRRSRRNVADETDVDNPTGVLAARLRRPAGRSPRPPTAR